MEKDDIDIEEIISIFGKDLVEAIKAGIALFGTGKIVFNHLK